MVEEEEIIKMGISNIRLRNNTTITASQHQASNPVKVETKKGIWRFSKN